MILRHEVRDIENHRACVAALVRVPVHLEPEIQILRPANLIRVTSHGPMGAKVSHPLLGELRTGSK